MFGIGSALLAVAVPLSHFSCRFANLSISMAQAGLTDTIPGGPDKDKTVSDASDPGGIKQPPTLSQGDAPGGGREGAAGRSVEGGAAPMTGSGSADKTEAFEMSSVFQV